MIPVSRPDLSPADGEAVRLAAEQTLVAGGPAIEELEATIAQRCGRRYGVAVSNGTSALIVAVAALRLPPGSRILVPSFTIVSAAYAVVVNGHVPVFIDVDPETWNVSTDTVDSATAAIDAAIIVETYASAPFMIEISELLSKADVPMIEDAAEGLGGSHAGRAFGSFGEMSTLSFYANKLITTGEGGMILTDDPDVRDRLLGLRNLGFGRSRDFVHHESAGNHRMSNLQAALGVSQSRRIDAFYHHRRELYSQYLLLLADHGDLLQTQFIPESVASSYWVFPVLLASAAHTEAAETIARLRAEGVEARHFFFPLDRQPWLQSFQQNASEIAFGLWQRGLYLPLGNGITQLEVTRAAESLTTVLRNNRNRVAR